jgi:hypothetical protein
MQTAKDLKYRQSIFDRVDRQTEKGISKYGGTLCASGHITKPSMGLEYLAEELTDGLVYIEHTQELISELERENALLKEKCRIGELALRAIVRAYGDEALIAKKALKDMGLEQ